MEFKEKTRPEKFAANLFDALFCRRDVDAVDAETRPVTFVSLFRFATTRDIALFVLGCFFAVIGGALQPMVMILDGQITSLFLLPGEKKGNEAFVVGVTKWLTLIAVFGIVCFVFSFFETFLLRRVSANVGQRLRTEFVRAVLRQDAVYFDDTAAGAITAQLNENVAKIEDGLGDKVGMLLRGFSMFTTSVAYCFSVNWQITVIAVSMGPLSSVTLGLMGTLLSSMTHKMMQTSSKASEVFEESVMNVKTIASCNAQEHMVKKYFRTLSEGISTVKTYNFWVGFFTGLSLYQILVLAGLSLWYGVHAFHSGLVGNAASVIMIIDTVCVTSYYLSLLGPHTMAIVKARVAAAVLYSTIKKDPTNDGNRNVEKITGRVVFDNIYFRYPNRDHLVLKGINWACEPGESVAFVGSSGCGKSTLISLITKLRSATAGKITIDGTSIEEFSVGSLRRLIGIVEQEPTLFNGTIMENIRLDRDDVSEEDAMQAAAISEAHGFIENLSEGYNTPIGDRGVQLSGGQKQRIAIARAIATNPKILLLDEATSALDSQSESVVQQALERASEGRATIAVTHRLSTLKYFDCIHVIHDGIIVEAGTHEELMELKGVYEKLAKGQGLEKSLPKRAATLRKRHQRVSTISTTPTSCAKEDSDAESEIEDEQEKSKKKRRNGLLLLYSNMDGHYGKALCMLFFALVRAIEMPLLSVSFYLAFLGLEATTGYETYALWSLLLQVASGFIVWWSMCATYMLSGWLAEGVTVNLRKRVLRSLLFRPAAFFERTSPAACISSVSHDAPNCAGAMDFNISQNISNFCSVVYHLAVTFFISWAMGVLGIGLCGLLYFLIFASMFLGNMARNAKSKNDKSGEFSIEVAEKAQTIQLLAVEARFVKKFEEYQSQARCYDIWVNCADAFNHAMCNSYVYFNDICCMALGTQLTFIGTTTVDLAFFAFSQVQFAGWSVMYTGPFLPDMIRASGAARHVFRFIDTDRRISETQTAGVKPYIDGKLTLSSVNFAYPSRPDQLVTKSLSMDVEPGENVALVGPSGCGKSTIVGLLEAFYSPQSGKIKLGKHLIEDINLPHLRKTIGLVEQEPVLFKGTIYENVALGADDVTIEDVMNACKAANCKFISAFPQGYETDVGEGGKALSGGQKQRIAIARMLVRKPKIILLDEATSALDTESEKTVQKALAEASVGRTSITIAHRLATIQKCDRIFFVDNGHVVECGTHEELLAQDGQYAQLVKVQILT